MEKKQNKYKEYQRKRAVIHRVAVVICGVGTPSSSRTKEMTPSRRSLPTGTKKRSVLFHCCTAHECGLLYGMFTGPDLFCSTRDAYRETL